MDLDSSANGLRSSLSEAKQSFLDVLPNLATAALIIALGWAIAWSLRKIIRRVLRRLSVQGPWDSSSVSSINAAPSGGAGEVVANAVYWLVLLTALVVAVDAFGLSVFSKWVAAFASYLPRLVIAMALLLGGIVAGRLGRNGVMKAAVRLPTAQARTMAWSTQIAIVVATILVAADQLGLDVSSLTAVLLIVLAAVLGGGALAFGLGAREVMSDILAMHYVTKYYRIGQIIRIGSDQGRILRTTRTAVFLESPDGEVSVPGRHFMDERCVLLNREEDREA